MRTTLHVAISLLTWGLFAYYWSVVLGRQAGPAALRAVLILGGLSAMGIAVTLAWVAHNRRLARRHAGRRATAASPAEEFLVDHLGRPLVGLHVAELREADVVDIGIDDAGCKTYAVRGPVTI